MNKSTKMFIGILILGIFLRLINLGRQSLSFDELGEFNAAIQNFPTLLHIVSTHISPPLDYIIMHFVLMMFPKEDVFIRLQSVIFGVASIVMIYFLSKKLFSEEVSLLSAFLLAISPFAIQYSQEARMYSLFVFLTILSYWFFIQRDSKKCFLFWIITNIALIYTHYFAVFIFLSQFVYIVIKLIQEHKQQNIFKYLIGLIIVVVSFFPWFNTFLYQIVSRNGSLSYGITSDWINFFVNPMFRFSGIQHVSGDIFVYVTIILVLVNGVITIKEKQIRILLLLWLILPLVLMWILTIKAPITTDKNMIMLLPAFVLLISVGITEIHKLEKKDLSYIFVIGIVVLNFISLNQYYNTSKEDWKGVGQYLNEYAKNGDTIEVAAGSNDFVKHYTTVNLTYSNNPEVINATLFLVSSNKEQFPQFEYSGFYYMTLNQTLEYHEWLKKNIYNSSRQRINFYGLSLYKKEN